MKRSQENSAAIVVVDKDSSRLELLHTYTQQRRDLEKMSATQVKTTEKMKEMVKEMIVENAVVLCPFRPRFVDRIGTIVDFGDGGDVCDPWILVEGEEDVDWFQIRYNKDDNELDVYDCDGCVDDTENVRHTFSIDGDKWLHCETEGTCSCEDPMSETSCIQRVIAQHPVAIAALIDELRRQYVASINDPHLLFDKIHIATRSPREEEEEEEQKKKKNKKKNKKRKKDEGK
jgi:hypothetical protein